MAGAVRARLAGGIAEIKQVLEAADTDDPSDESRGQPMTQHVRELPAANGHGDAGGGEADDNLDDPGDDAQPHQHKPRSGSAVQR
jgi:hypothetical protein